MTDTPTIALSQSRDIPFNRLVLSIRNVRRIQTGLSIEELAEDIARRTLLQSLSVRPIENRDGFYEVQAGGRRYRALELLVKTKRMTADTPIPCIIREDGILEEDSLAENVQRQNLHPLDQFRAFQTLRDQGLGEEEIAARFFVTPQAVKQRLKLASVSPKLLELYATNEMTLEQLMAFTVSDDHAKQEEIWEAINQGYNQGASYIRRLLTQNTIDADDYRVRYVGLEAYQAAGGGVLRDLFAEDNEGWIQDAGLLERLFTEKLNHEAEDIRAEGWKWIEVAADFPHGHTRGMQRIIGEEEPLSAAEEAQYKGLIAEKKEIEYQYFQDGCEEIPDDIEQRLIQIEGMLEELNDRSIHYAPEDKARARAFVSVDTDGTLSVERGFTRIEDSAQNAVNSNRIPSIGHSGGVNVSASNQAMPTGGDPENDDEAMKPLSDKLVMELTAHRTLALRNALAKDSDMAFLAVLHALVLQSFYRFATDTCLEITAKCSSFPVQSPDLKTSPSAIDIDRRHDALQKLLPEAPAELWDRLRGLNAENRMALFAHCASLSINAVREPWNRAPGRRSHANQLASALDLDMTAAGWKLTVGNYLGRVSKAHILDAVAETKGAAAVELIEHMRKVDMAQQAERMLADTGWLPEPLRTPDIESAPLSVDEGEPELPPDPVAEQEEAGDDLPAFLCDAA